MQNIANFSRAFEKQIIISHLSLIKNLAQKNINAIIIKTFIYH